LHNIEKVSVMVRFPRLGGRAATYPAYNEDADDSQAASEDAGDAFGTEDPVSSLLESSVRRRSSVPAADIERATRQYSLSTSLNEDIFEENGPSKIGNCGETEEEEIDPFSKNYVGLTASYLGVGAMLGTSSSLLYPLLIVKNGVSSSFMAASQSVVMLWWSYKVRGHVES